MSSQRNSSHRSKRQKKQLERKINLPISLSSSNATTVPALLANFKSNVAVIVTHPWGILGGNMQNNVVAAICAYFQNLEITTLRFNFPGSQISRGYSEVTSVVTAVQYLLNGGQTTVESSVDETANEQKQQQQQNTPKSILLIGYSYGSLIAGSASASIPECIGTVYIACPFSMQQYLLLFNARYHLKQSKFKKDLHRLFIHGTKDNFTSTDTFHSWIKSDFSMTSTTVEMLDEADHFFRYRENEVAKTIEKWILKSFPALDGNIKNFCSFDINNTKH